MKRIVYILSILIMFSSCSILQKSKKIEKEKLDISDFQESKINFNSESSNHEVSEIVTDNQLIGLLSAINWQYQGKDSAEIEIIQTTTGIKIKTKGNAIADLKTNSESQLNKNHTKSESQSVNYNSLELDVENSKELSKESEKVELEKDIKRADVSIWIYFFGFLILVIIVILFWFFGLPKGRVSKNDIKENYFD